MVQLCSSNANVRLALATALISSVAKAVGVAETTLSLPTCVVATKKKFC